tara:strand:+ start:99 stop:506 length:408 start_codon:yes stop_codon:yes gene_type:complete
MILSSNFKKNLLNILENIIKKISLKTGLTMREIGIIIRSFHSIMPIFPLFTVLFVNKTFVLFHIIILITIMLLFIIFDGCILSLLEYRLCKDDYTIVDPYLDLIFIEINNETRKKYTILPLFGILLYFIFIYNIK